MLAAGPVALTHANLGFPRALQKATPASCNSCDSASHASWKLNRKEMSWHQMKLNGEASEINENLGTANENISQKASSKLPHLSPQATTNPINASQQNSYKPQQIYLGRCVPFCL